MPTIQNFEDLEIWQLARKVNLRVYQWSKTSGLSKDYVLKDQILRSSGSVADNIAEGFNRGGKKEFIQYLYISKGSNAEVKSQLYRCRDLGYFSESQFKELYDACDLLTRKIQAFINYLKTTEYRGIKFKSS